MNNQDKLVTLIDQVEDDNLAQEIRSALIAVLDDMERLLNKK